MVTDRFDIPLRRDEEDDVEAEPTAPPIEPGDPSPENVIFVLLGVLVALAVVVRLVQLFA